MGKELFRFKHFSASHENSSMKIGVDSVILGAWTKMKKGNGLDLGTGCGILALMMAQKEMDLNLKAIDIDVNSVAEAKLNFENSSCNDRLEAQLISFEELIKTTHYPTYDLIVTNPPYFSSGVKELSTSRLAARHQGSLTPEKIIEGSAVILKKGGKLNMIYPYILLSEIPKMSKDGSLELSRICRVKAKATKAPNRVMLEFTKNCSEQVEDTTFVLYEEDNGPTVEYLNLCKDFYLKF